MKESLISVIIPVYEEGKQLYENICVIRSILQENNFKNEMIIVDDGSKDNTWEVIKKLSSDFENIKAVRFSRNFGKEAALCAGLESAQGDACIIMDSDLQHPPRLIPEMVRMWKEQGFDVIDGIKSERGNERMTAKAGALLFYRIFKRLSGVDLDKATDFKLLDAKVVSAWRQMGERNTFFRGMAEWVGFNRTSIPFEVPERSHGSSKWPLIKLFKLAVTAITSFSSMPLQLITFLGIIFLVGSFVLFAQTLYMKLAGIAVSGFTTVILLLLIIGSVLMISLGIIGTYIAKIYDEVKARPRYVIKEKINGIPN